jgi:hypothetical protein
MMRRGMADSGIGIGAPPRQYGGAINDQIARANQTATDGDEDREHEETFMHRRSGGLAALALLRRAGNPVLSLLVQRQAAGMSEGRPGP